MSSFDVADANLLQQACIFGHEARTTDDLGSENWGQFALRAVPEQHAEYLGKAVEPLGSSRINLRKSTLTKYNSDIQAKQSIFP